jgi:WD40 repeat protein
MKSRITVTGIFNLQLNRRIFSSDKDLTISCCFSNSELMLLGINNRGIIAYRLPNFDILAEYPLQQKVTKIVQHKAYFFVVCADRPTILCLEWSDNKLTLNNQLEGHLLPVNSISITNQEEPVSCSDDFTLRLWQSE